MQSWSLKKFVEEHSVREAGVVWGGKTHQAVYDAINGTREISVLLIKGIYEVRESKRLHRMTESEFKLSSKSKVCTQCGITKPVADFHRSATGSLGRVCACKECLKY